MRPIRITVERGKELFEREYDVSPIQIGRNPKADLQLPYEFVSSWHALIQFDEKQATFFDLGSTNGTLLEGQRIGPGQEVPFDTDPVRLRIDELTLTLRRVAATHASATGSLDTAPPEAPAPTPGVQAMLKRLQPLYEQLQVSTLTFDDALGREMMAIHPQARDFASYWVQRTFPPSGAARRVGTGGGRGGRGVEGIAELLSFVETPSSADGVRDLVRRVVDVMRVCAKGLVEMQEGQERMSQEFGVKAVKHYTGLRFALSANEALSYLFSDPDPAEHRRRLDELSAAFSDTMSHQIATINGVVAGARALLDELEPGAIERGADPGRLTRSRDCWKTFVTRWERLANQDKPLLAVLFGPEFARVYQEVGGELSNAWQRELDQQNLSVAQGQAPGPGQGRGGVDG